MVVFSEILRIRKHCLKELQGNDFYSVVIDFIYARHSYILNHTKMGKIFLTECHPETRTFDRRIVLYKRFEFFVIEQIAFAGPDFRIIERFVEFERTGCYPFAVLIITSVLRNFPDIDFRVEVGGESLAMVTGVTVDDVESLHIGKIMFGGIGCKYARHSRVETTTEYGGESGLFKTFFISPLP